MIIGQTQPLVAIALCTYNGGYYLSDQIESILQQSYTNLEIVIVDDASTDNTIEIITDFSQKDKRIKVYQNKVNLGYNKNFEKAIGLTTADYIAVSDQDDKWEKNKIERIMELWPEDADFVYSLSGNFNDDDFENRTEAPKVIYGPVSDVHKLVFNSPVHGHACIFKKKIFSMSIPFPHDIFYDWWMSMHAAATGIIGCVPETLTWHRNHGNNSSRNITSIKDKEERNNKLRLQCAYFIETFCNKGLLKDPQKKSLLTYASLLKKMDGKHFSWPMFQYILKNRKLVFHFKKQKPLIFISYLKHAYRMAYKGLF
ncbi:MAG TPA: glycosyltransferase [Chitinophagaceae bacterium]|nr:glycosyltransferase [Chitinophagaceae bacterium]